MPGLGPRDQGNELKQHGQRQDPDRSGADCVHKVASLAGELDSERTGDHGGPQDAQHHPPAKKRRYSWTALMEPGDDQPISANRCASRSPPCAAWMQPERSGWRARRDAPQLPA